MWPYFLSGNQGGPVKAGLWREKDKTIRTMYSGGSERGQGI